MIRIKDGMRVALTTGLATFLLASASWAAIVTVGDGAAAIGDNSTATLPVVLTYQSPQDDPGLQAVKITINYPAELEFISGSATQAALDANDGVGIPDSEVFNHDGANRKITVEVFSLSAAVILANTTLANIELGVADGVTESGTVQVQIVNNIGSTYVTPYLGEDALPTVNNGDFEIRKLFNAANTTLTMAEDGGKTAVPPGAFTNELGNPVAGTVTGITVPASNGTATVESGTIYYTPNPNYFGGDSFTYTATGTGGTDTATVTVTVNPVDDAPVLAALFVVNADADAYTAINPPSLSETGPTYQVAIVAYDIDTNLNNLAASAVDNQTVPSRGSLAFDRKEVVTGGTVPGYANDTVWFWFDFPVDQDTVQHPAQSKNVSITGYVSDNTPLRSTVEQSIEVTIADVDRLPTGTLAINITPGAPKTTSTLLANVDDSGISDPDGDGWTVGYDWSYVQNRVLQNFDDAGIVLPAATAKHQTWTVDVIVRTNPYGLGASDVLATMGSDSVDILNSDPTLGTTALKMFIQKTDPVVLPVTKMFNLGTANPADADGDFLQYIITSLPAKGTLSYDDSAGVRGPSFTDIVSVPTTLPLGVSQVLYTVTAPADTEYYNGNPDAGNQADMFQYTVTDGDNPPVRGTSQNVAMVTVEYRTNQPPVLVTATPEVPSVMDEVVVKSQIFNATFTDDDDPSGNGAMESIRWYTSEDDGATWDEIGDRSPLSSQFTFNTDYSTVYNDMPGSPGAGQRPASKVFKIKAVGSDTQGGETDHIWNVTVNDVDRDPSAPDVNVTPDPAYTTDDLTATITLASTDLDGDAITGYDYTWSSAVRLGPVDSDTLDSSNTSKHQTWTVTAKAKTNPYGTGDVISDNYGQSSTDVINSAPVAKDDEGETDEETPIVLPVVLGPDDRNFVGTVADTDADGDNLTVVSVTQPAKGVATKASDKTVGFDPAGQMEYLGFGQSETVSFMYTITDNDAIDPKQSTADVYIKVNGVNDAPVADSQTVTTEADTALVITLTGSDVDQNDNLVFVPTFESAVNTEKGGTVVLSNTRLLNLPVLGSIEVLYTPPVGFIGVDSFTFELDDSQAARSNMATVTIVVGTPLWYPYFELNDLLAERPGLVEERWYHIEIVDGDGKTVVDTGIYGTAMDPIDYFRAGSEGLLPGTYTVHFETWNPGAGTYGNEGWSGQIVVTDYGYADTPTDLNVIPPISRGAGSMPGTFHFEFRAMNGRGYVLNLYRNGKLYRTYRNVFLPDATGKLIPLNQLTSLPVDLDESGNYTAEVRAFNPLDESVEGDLSRAGTPGPRWADFTPFTVTADGDGGDPGDPEGQVFPNGEVFVAPAGSIEITLQWNPIPEAVGYRLYLGAGNAAPIFDGLQVGATTSWRVKVPLGSYIWQVVGVNAAGNGTWSAPYVFDVVRDATAPLIRRVFVGESGVRGDGERGVVIITLPETLTIEYAPDSVAATKIDIQHYQTANPEGWKVYTNVTVNQHFEETLGWVAVPGANFQVGDYILIKAYAADGKRTDYRVFVIESDMIQKPE